MKYRTLVYIAMLLPISACARNSVELRSKSDPDFTVSLEEYAPKGQERPFQAVIFPPTGGSTLLDRSYANSLAKSGVRTLILTHWSGLEEIATDPELHDRHIVRAKKAFQVLAETYRGPYRLLGTSVGGMYAAAVAAEEAKVEAWATIASGAPFSFVLSRSSQESVAELREKRKPRWKFSSQEEYEAMLGGALSEDILPPRFPILALPGTEGEPSKGVRWTQNRILQVICTEDSSVPSESQELFWRAAGEPSRIDIEAGHVWGIFLAYWNHKAEIVNFLAEP